nr:MAG TPA: hypothetical protein [Caudoviricetes sp.]
MYFLKTYTPCKVYRREMSKGGVSSFRPLCEV